MNKSPRGFTSFLGILVCFLACPSLGLPQSEDLNPLGEIRQQAESPDAQDADEQGKIVSSPGGGTVGPDYVLGPEDVINIDVFSIPELRQTVRVENDGTISVKLLGHVKAAGLTTAQLKDELQNEWGKTYLQDPKVNIFIREFHAQPVSVLGAVEKPGLYQLTGPRSVIEVLSMAGGLASKSNGAPGRSLYVTRKGGFGDLDPVEGMELVAPDQVEVDLKKLLQAHDPSLNFQVKPFDQITVAKAGIVYITGAVKKPGGFLLEDKDSVTVLQALAMAEGLGPNPAKSAAVIMRRQEDGTKQEIPVDVGKIENGQADDLTLASNDVLVVPTSNAKYGVKRSVDIALATLTGLLVYRGF